jgi:uncharacterized Zn-finger protein
MFSSSLNNIITNVSQQFPPPIMPVSVTLTPSSGANPWQHHHYISPSSAASFPQSQDRYICQTCNKAFSRPSSLRIHSHSHTGEKPFKCPHQGCGKAFSVRSNMKRHERGCHSFEGGAMVWTSPSRDNMGDKMEISVLMYKLQCFLFYFNFVFL